MWVKPSVVEVKMDAEIGSYQEDDPGRDPRFVSDERTEEPTKASRKPSRITVEK